MSTEPDARTGEALDDELAALLDVESFEPPADFREHALLSDPGVYEQAERDPQAWWVTVCSHLAVLGRPGAVVPASEVLE